MSCVRLRPSRRALTPLVAAALLCLPLTLPAAAVDERSTTWMEVALTDLANAERARAGLHPLRIDVRLIQPARAWSAELARAGALSHDSNLHTTNPPGATAWAENVGRTTEPDAPAALHAGFMDSPQHRDYLLDPRFGEIGVGVVRSGEFVYVTQRFTGGAPARIGNAVQPTAELAQRLYAGHTARHAVVVRDDLFPDALAAGPLAGAEGPILFSPPGGALHPHVRLALEATVAPGSMVWIVGGAAAVTGDVERELAAAGWRIRRLWGSDRIHTAAEVARAVAGGDRRPQTALLATAADWPDAASGGAYGASARAPVLLVRRDELPPPSAAALEALQPRRVVVLGGAAVVSDRVAEQAGADRVEGATRQDTAAAAARALWGCTDAVSAPAWTVVPAEGDGAWAWALGAAPLAARSGAPVLLAATPLSGGLREYLQGLAYGDGHSARLQVFGTVEPGAIAELAELTS